MLEVESNLILKRQRDRRVGIIQSCYIPWRGYFDFIKSVDVFIVHDDLQYTKLDWRNRNRIKTPNGPKWLTVPVVGSQSHQTRICDTLISYQQDWITEHVRQLKNNYGRTPYFSYYAEPFFEILSMRYKTISELNVVIMRWLLKILGIQTPIIMSMELDPRGVKTDRVIDLLNKVGATSYLSGPSAKSYLDEQKFIENKIALEYKCYDYEPYEQIYGPFLGEVTILDLLFHKGPSTPEFLTSRIENIRVV